MKKILFAFIMMLTMSGCNNNPATKTGSLGEATVYLTREISPESLVNIYKALGVPAQGRVAIKMSTGEGSNPNYLKPELVKDLFFEVSNATPLIAAVPMICGTTETPPQTTGRSSGVMVSPSFSPWISWTSTTRSAFR